MAVVDVHAHFIPRAILEKAHPSLEIRVAKIGGEEYIEAEAAPHGPVIRTFTDVEGRLKDLDSLGIDKQVVSLPPWMYMYWRDASIASSYAKLVNDEFFSELKGQDRLFPLALVNLKDVDSAVKELERTVSKFGFRGVSISTNFVDRNLEYRSLDDTSLWPFYEAVQRLEVPVFIHPINVAGVDRMRYYYLPILLGGPFDTTIAAAGLMFGGVMDEFPKLKIYLAHGGGSLPYLRGRLEKGLGARAEPGLRRPRRKVEEYYRWLYYDTVVYESSALQLLIETVPRDHVMFGSDLPSEMAIEDGVKYVKDLGLSEADQRMILGANAERLFHLN